MSALAVVTPSPLPLPSTKDKEIENKQKKLSLLKKQRSKKKERKKRKQKQQKNSSEGEENNNNDKYNNHPSNRTHAHASLHLSDTSLLSVPHALSMTTSDVEIEYVAADPLENVDPDDEDSFLSLREVLDHFLNKSNAQMEDNGSKPITNNKEEEKPVQEKLSKKRRKLQRRLPIAVLKQLVSRPDLVEIHDTCAADPFLLLALKSYQNTVPVPRHWSQKRKYLQGKRGIEKPPFDLPFFIKKTGIMEVRSAGLEKDSEKTLKQEQREKLNPSMGKMDIDYQVLHDAFFKYQTKPKMTGYGDLYYEGKEYEVEMKEKRPGVLSKELKEALGMPDGAPPPWLINMQRVGPPPSYPHLKIPGLNAPIPPGAEYGYHPGGWGRPPLDEHNRPLYMAGADDAEPPKPAQYIEIAHWGRLPSDEEESSAEEPAQEEKGEEEGDKEGEEEEEGPADIDIAGIETPLSGLETPQNLETNIRKPVRKEEGKELYQVLEEREASVGNAVFGSNKQYVIDKVKKPKITDRVELMKSQKTEGIELALDPSELSTLTEESLKKRYDKVMQEKKDKEGKGGMDTISATSNATTPGTASTGTTPGGVGADANRKRKRNDSGKKNSKKYKDFKF